MRKSARSSFKHNSIRLKGWDYRSPAFYFVTFCTRHRHHIFSNPIFKELADNAIENIPTHDYAHHVRIDESTVMPDHAHIIFQFLDYPLNMAEPFNPGEFRNALTGSLGMIVGQYKTAVTSRINQLRKSVGAKVWQPGYYDRIIRDEKELDRIRHYVRDNPRRWNENRNDLDNLLTKMRYHPT